MTASSAYTQVLGEQVLCTHAVRRTRALQLVAPLLDGGLIERHGRAWAVTQHGVRVDVIPRHLVLVWRDRGVVEAVEPETFRATPLCRDAVRLMTASSAGAVGGAW